VFKHDGAGGKGAGGRPARLCAPHSDRTLSAPEVNPPPNTPSAGVPPASSPRPVAKVGAKSPRGVPPPPQPTVKRPRRDTSAAAAAGPASPAVPRKASTPVTPAPSNSGSEDSFGAGAATTAAAARPVPPPVRVPSLPEDDEALARRLHAELNCTPARASRARGGQAPSFQAGRDRIHGDDPGLLPSCCALSRHSCTREVPFGFICGFPVKSVSSEHWGFVAGGEVEHAQAIAVASAVATWAAPGCSELPFPVCKLSLIHISEPTRLM
jgi:hypothetical protein